MTPAFVLDSSVTMAWCFGDEFTPAIAKLQDQLIDAAAIVPPHWPLEVINVLRTAEKRRRISVADSQLFVQSLRATAIQIDDGFSNQVFDHCFALCRAHGLTSYDAAYLELALRQQLPLASLDDDLRRIAKQLGVKVLGK